MKLTKNEMWNTVLGYHLQLKRLGSADFGCVSDWVKDNKDLLEKRFGMIWPYPDFY